MDSTMGLFVWTCEFPLHSPVYFFVFFEMYSPCILLPFFYVSHAFPAQAMCSSVTFSECLPCVPKHVQHAGIPCVWSYVEQNLPCTFPRAFSFSFPLAFYYKRLVSSPICIFGRFPANFTGRFDVYYTVRALLLLRSSDYPYFPSGFLNVFHAFSRVALSGVRTIINKAICNIVWGEGGDYGWKRCFRS